MTTYQIRFSFGPTVETFTDRAAFLRRQVMLQDWHIAFTVATKKVL